MDYVAGTHTVMVSRPDVPVTSSFEENLPNVTFVEPFEVLIISDGVLEGLEDFECHIVSTSHDGVLIGNQSSVPVTIVDQDSESDQSITVPHSVHTGMTCATSRCTWKEGLWE